MPTVPGVTGQNPYDDILRQQEEAAGPTVIPDQDLGQGFRTSNVPQAPGVIVNPYDRMFEEGRKRTEVMARMTALDTSGKDPEQYAEWIKLGQEIGLPVQAVENDPENAKQIQRLNRWAKMAQESPQVAAWMSIADNGVLAQDDIEVLSSIEKLRRGANDLAIAAPAGLASSLVGPAVSGFGDIYDGLTVAMSTSLNAAGAPEIITGGDNFRPVRVDEEYWWANPANWFRALGDPITRAGAEAIPEERQNYATDVVGGLAQLVGQIALTRINPAAAAIATGSAGAEQQATRAEQAGATEQEKAAAVFIGAGITAAVERFGVDMILERVPPQIRDRSLRWIVDRTLAGGIEAGQEAVEAVANNIVARSIYDPEAGLFDGAGDNAAVGFGVGFIARAIFGARMRDMESNQARSEQTSVDALVDLASQSTLRQRDPGKFQDLMNRLAGEADANYHVDAQEFNKLYQSKGMNPETVAAEFGVDADAYRIATLSDGELLIPLGTYLAKVDKADHARLSTFAKMTAGGLTPAEADINDETIARQADLIRAGIQAEVAGDNRIRDDIVGMVVGRYDRDTAEKYGTVMQAAMRSMAERAGVNPWQLYSRYRLKVKNELPGMQNARPVDTLLDPLIERLRAGDIPTESQARGPTLAEFLAGQGGINDEAMAGELRSLQESDRATRRGKKKLVRDDAKYTLDGALEASVEAGYLPEGADLNDLLAALTDEVVTERPTYALQNEDARVLGDRINLLQLDEELSSRGIDIKKASNEQIKQALGANAAADVQALYNQVGPPGSDSFRAWFRESKVVNEDGTPRIVFHGTGEEFRAFDERLLGGATGHATTGLGFFFGIERSEAESYADKASDGVPANAVVLDVYLSIQNPYMMTLEEAQGIEDKGEAVAIRQWLQSQGYDGIFVEDQNAWVAFSATQIKSVNNIGTWSLVNPDMYAQSGQGQAVPPEKELVAIHNLSTENLLFADKLGGLAVPSIGVTKADTQFAGFGDITLIGRRDLATPSDENPVFSADAYTQRFPDLIWAKVPSKKANAFVESFGESYQERDTGQFWDDLVNSPNRDRAIENARRSSTMMRAWIKEQGEAPAARVTAELRTPTRAQWAKQPAFVDAIKSMADRGIDVDNARPGDEAWSEISRAAMQAIEAEAQVYAEKSKQLGDQMREAMLGNAFEDGELFFSAGDAAVRYVQSIDKPRGEDNAATRRDLEKQIGERMPQFEQWVAEKIALLFDPPKIMVGKRKVEMTLENVVDAMTASRKVAGKEKTMTFSGGQVKAANAKQFQSLEEIKASRDMIVSPSEEKAAVDAVDKLMDQYRTAALQFFTQTNWRGDIDTWAGLDASMKALADAAKKAATPANVRAALQKNGFRGMDAETIELGVQALQSVRQTVVDYFEAKPQRAVSLSEFAGAVIPSNAPQEVRDALSRAGVPVAEYDRADGDARRATVARFARDLNAQAGDVLFQSPDTDTDTDNRGAFYYRKNDGGATIQLNPKADASTFIHESAHFFLEVMGDLVKNNEASPEMQADFSTLLTWAGTDPDKWFGMTFNQRRDAHERVARGFEAYVREGKAPSADLAGPFERFRGWLLAIYRSITQLNVELSDEVRGVFDRMLATDAEIQRTEADNDYAPLFREAAAAGIPQEQFQSYVDLMGEASREARDALAARAVRDVYREREAWWKEEAAGVRAEVEAEVNQSPLYRAWYYMAFGTQPDGSPLPEGMERAKLDRDWLIAQYGHEWVKKHLLRKRVYAVDGGGDPDLLAAGFGFDSGDAMIQALANAQPRKAYIEAEVSRRMQEKHGDLVSDDGQLAEAAQKAVHNSKRLKAIDAEMAMLARLAGQPKGTTTQIRRVAESMVARMKLRDINPNAYLRAERKNARLAQDFFAKGDFVKALDAKRKQALNAHLYDVTLKAKEEGEKIRDYVKRFEKVKLRERLGKVGRLNEVDALLDVYDLRRVSGREIDRRKAQGELLQAIKDGLLIAPRAVVERMKVDGSRTNYRELTMENLRGLRDVLRQMEKEARNEYEALLYGEKIDLDQKAEEMAAAILANNKQVAPQLGQEAPAEAVRRYGKQALNAWLRPAAIARLLDGSDNGPMTRLIIQPIRDAVARVLEPMKVKAAQDLADLYSKHYTTKEMAAMNERTMVPGLKSSLSRWDLISLAMNWGNAENREALLKSQVADMQPFTQAGLEQALGTLTARDWAFVQDSWDYIDSYWPQIKAAQERRRGIAPPKVEALPFEIQTADGQTVMLRGGYHPLRYNANLDARVRQDEINMTFEQMIAGTMSAVQTKYGHNKERVGSGGKPVTLGMNVMHQHVNNVIQDIALGDVVMMVDKLLKRQPVRNALIQTGNMDTLEVMRLWLKDVATGEMAARTGMEKATQFLRRNFTLSKIGFNVVTALLGVTGFAQTSAVVGSKWMFEGAKDYGKNPKQAIAQVMDQSDFMRLRYEIGAFNKDIADFRQAMQNSGPVTKSGGALNGLIVAFQKSQMPPAFADAAFWMIRSLQMQIDTATWLAGYHKAKGQNMPHDEAVRYADGIVENAQTSGLFSDRGGFERGTFNDTTRQAEFVKIWTTLGSYMIAKGNIAFESYKRTDFRNPAQVAGFMGDIGLLFFVEMFLAAALRGSWPSEEEEWWWWTVKTGGEQMLGTVPIVRELPSAFKGFGSGGGPLGAVINDTAKVVKQTSQAEVDAALLKAYVNMIGTLTGAPSAQTNRAIDAAWREGVEGEDVNSYEYILGKRQNAQ